MRLNLSILLITATLLIGTGNVMAQTSNDTIRLGAIIDEEGTFPMVFLEEFIKPGQYINPEDKKRRDRLRHNIYVVYPYAITAATILKDVHTNLENMDRRKDRRQYIKSVNRQLDAAFKEPLKNLTIDQGHVLIKLINRQTGQDCYSIIRELKGGISAVAWQSVGVLFNNNLRRDYDPTGVDMEMEAMVQVLESASNYRYHLYIQKELMKKIPKTVARKDN